VGLLIDTSVLIAWERGHARVEDVTEDAAISVITVTELLQGAHRARGAHRVRRTAAVNEVLAEFDVVDITVRVARVHSEIWAELVRAGTTVGDHDMWIGATALAHGLGVITRDGRDFARIPGLRVETV
jgi:predicted nucleic acid-binding protein